ncbi:MAG: SGNH/GDSL hydrolase family protein [Lentisphaeraceae bacterium]|nr:SGNH/GDSL hydrolase family protein [Lentisphaeraceae bacterium]
MKNYLCFGDSNTWGFIPATDFERYPFEQRVCGHLQKELGSGVRIIEEALNGRMTGWDDPLNVDKNAARQLPFILDSHRPLNLVSVMLGINDMKHYMNKTAIDSAMAISQLIEQVRAADCGREGACPEIIIISPPVYIDTEQPFGHIFDGAVEKSRGFAEAYKEVAEENGVHFFDAALYATPPISGDGVHIDAAGTKAIGEALAKYIQLQNLL